MKVTVPRCYNESIDEMLRGDTDIHHGTITRCAIAKASIYGQLCRGVLQKDDKTKAGHVCRGGDRPWEMGKIDYK